jgi:MFS family permease
MNSNSFALKRFVVSRFLGTLSDQFLLFAVPLAIFQSTGSVTYSGLAFVIEWLPRIVFFPLGGFVADRMKPRQLFFGVELGRALVLTLASILIATGSPARSPCSTMMALFRRLHPELRRHRSHAASQPAGQRIAQGAFHAARRGPDHALPGPRSQRQSRYWAATIRC